MKKSPSFALAKIEVDPVGPAFFFEFAAAYDVLRLGEGDSLDSAESEDSPLSSLPSSSDSSDDPLDSSIFLSLLYY